jgi:phosphoenolpyruvate phosphomutase
MSSLNTDVIIVAAGLGSRLKNYTNNSPKCMLDFGGKTLLQRQIEAFNENGLNKISVIRGFKKEKINYPDLTYFENKEYKNNNILNSLMYAEEALNGHVIVSYSDILFEKEVVGRLMKSEHDISIVVDIDWRGYYVDRNEHPINEAENVIFDVNNNVVEIGKILTNKHDVHGEFIGMMKFSPRGSEIFKRHFHRSKELFWDKPFQRTKIFQKAYITDMIQEMSDLGVPIHCVIIERGWKEIDTEEDYKNALKAFEGEL